MSNHREWTIRNEFNSFNTMKVVKHVDYWSKIDIEKPYIPPPIAVTIDPCNMCNYRCVGCNAQKVIADSNSVMSEDWMARLPRFLSNWGVKAVTLAGGGEPLLSPYIGKFLAESENCSYELALITNGYSLKRYMLPIALSMKWIGVSIDAASADTYSKIKNCDPASFDKVLKNVAELSGLNSNVTFKFLMNKQNIGEVYAAVKLAKGLGCCAIHLRPIGLTWYDEDRRQIFTSDEVEKALDEIGMARRDYEDEDFRVFGVTHKFDKNWQLANCFESCWSCFMYLVIEPNGVVSTCCDNRGNPAMQLATGLSSPWEILEYWGSEKHIEMFKQIDVKKCPRCTFVLHNQLYEQEILGDAMDSNFI